MAYSKQSFADGQKLTADHMNHIENGLAALDTGKLDAAELASAVSEALAQAADSDFKGEAGVGITGIALTSGSGAPGTRDTYTISLSDGSSYTFSVYNGADGSGGSGSGGNSVGVSAAEINDDGHLIITLSDGSAIDAGKARGEEGPQGARGNRWYLGTAITGVNTSGASFSSSEVEMAYFGDLYLNTTYYRIYQCIYTGAPADAKWVYIGSIKGASGQDGADSISSAAVNASGNLVLTLSNGNTLNAGKVTGEDGYAPRVSVNTTSGGHYVEIKSMDEGLVKTEGFFVLDGVSPVRGTDYWTADDIAAIQSYVDDAILGGTW